MPALDLVATERRAVAEWLDTLTDAQLSAPSLCAGWTVRDVAAHLLSPLVLSRIQTVGIFLTSGASVSRTNARMTAAVARRSTAEITAGLRANAAHPFRPPGHTHGAPLVDAVVHGQDMRRPLGVSYRPSDEALRTVLDYLTGPRGTRGFVRRGLLGGLHLTATDLDWTYGSGAGVHGPAVSLLLALTGRPAGLDDLDGDGVATLRRRLS